MPYLITKHYSFINCYLDKLYSKKRCGNKYLVTKLFIIKFCLSTPFFVQLLQECRAFLKTSLDQDNYILYCCPNGEAGCLCPCSTTIDKKCPYCWFLRLELEGIIERWQICNSNPSKWPDIQKGIDCLISDSNESDSDDGNAEEEEEVA